MARPKDDFEKRRLKLATEAKGRIASRRRKSPKLARLYDDLILNSLSVFDAYDRSRPFYERGAHVDYCTFVSVTMDGLWQRPKGVLQLWQDLIHTPLHDLAKCPPSNEQHTSLIDVTHALEDLLYMLSGTIDDRRFDYVSKEWWTEFDHNGFHWVFWELLRLTVEVNIREIDNFLTHPEIWKKEIFDGGANQIGFMFDGSIEDYRKMWESVKTKFYSLNPTWALGMCDHFLTEDIADYPLAFCFAKSEHNIHRLGYAAKQALLINSELKFDYDNETLMWSPCETMVMAAINVCWSIVDYFRRARALCDPASASYRKWLDAEAEIIAHCGAEADPITAEVASHIVTLANEAAREHWIEARIGSNTSKRDAALDQLLRESISVRLVDVAPSAGKSLRAALKDPGGRPPKTHGGAKVMTQAEMATAFGEPCNENMVNGWEARAAGKKRGANPPDTLYNGERIIYSAELRTNPTPDNENRLSALIAEFQSRHRIKDAIGEKARHFKSPETLAKASGQTTAAIREQSQLKYVK